MANLPKVYNWKVKRSGSGLVILGYDRPYATGRGERYATKIQCKSIELWGESEMHTARIMALNGETAVAQLSLLI